MLENTLNPIKVLLKGCYLFLSTLTFINITSLVFAINSVSDGIHPVLIQVIARIGDGAMHIVQDPQSSYLLYISAAM